MHIYFLHFSFKSRHIQKVWDIQKSWIEKTKLSIFVSSLGYSNIFDRNCLQCLLSKEAKENQTLYCHWRSSNSFKPAIHSIYRYRKVFLYSSIYGIHHFFFNFDVGISHGVKERVILSSLPPKFWEDHNYSDKSNNSKKKNNHKSFPDCIGVFLLLSI